MRINFRSVDEKLEQINTSNDTQHKLVKENLQNLQKTYESSNEDANRAEDRTSECLERIKKLVSSIHSSLSSNAHSETGGFATKEMRIRPKEEVVKMDNSNKSPYGSEAQYEDNVLSLLNDGISESLFRYAHSVQLLRSSKVNHCLRRSDDRFQDLPSVRPHIRNLFWYRTKA